MVKDHIQQQEDDNWDACREAFIDAHPRRPTYLHLNCEDMEWACAHCPFKTKEKNDGDN